MAKPPKKSTYLLTFSIAKCKDCFKKFTILILFLVPWFLKINEKLKYQLPAEITQDMPRPTSKPNDITTIKTNSKGKCNEVAKVRKCITFKEAIQIAKDCNHFLKARTPFNILNKLWSLFRFFILPDCHWIMKHFIYKYVSVL